MGREGGMEDGGERGRKGGEGATVREDRREGSRADPLPLFTAKYVRYH